MTIWVIEDQDGAIHQVMDDPAVYYPDAPRSAELPRLMNLALERWDWDAGCIASCFSPQQARDVMWEQAKEYREERRNAPLPVPGILVSDTIVVDCDLESRLTIAAAVQMATLAKGESLPYEITFTDHQNEQHTLNADQVIALGVAVASYHGQCHLASQAIRDQLDAAVAAGFTADQILAVDITAGYPATP